MSIVVSLTTTNITVEVQSANPNGGSDHNHDDRYYTESEVNLLIAEMAEIDVVQEWSKAQRYAISALSIVSSAVDWNLDNEPFATLILSEDVTVNAPSNIRAGTTYVLYLIQDATGSRTVAWNSVYKWPGATAPVLTTDANAVDIIVFTSRDGSTLEGVGQLNFS